MSDTLLSVTLLCLCAPPVEKSPTPTTHLYVRTVPSGAKVLLDGKPLGTSPGVFPVEPGVRRIVIELDDYEHDDKEITIRAGRVTRLEVRLRNRSSGELAPESARETHAWPISGVRILDAETKKPVSGCSLTFAGWGRVVYTDKDGVYRGEGNDFVQRLADGSSLQIRHPDYQSLSKDAARFRSVGGLLTAYLTKEGNASLTVDVSLTVRGQKTDASCRVSLLEGHQEPRGREIRRIERSEDRVYRFSGLAPGDYTIEAYFWDSYPTHYEPIHLAAGENKVVHIDSKTDQVARIRLEGIVLDKRNGTPVEGLRVNFCGAPDDDVLTEKDGRFLAAGDRGRFNQTYLYQGGRLIFWAEMDHHMPEELAQRLEFHVDPTNPTSRVVPVTDETRDGVFCDGQNCAICEQRRQASEQSVEAVLREFEAAGNELDVERLKAIVLPPDDTPAGQTRREWIEDWKAEFRRRKPSGEKAHLRFVDTDVKPDGPDRVVRSMLLGSLPDPNTDLWVGGRVELRLVRTPEGWKIAEIRVATTKYPPSGTETSKRIHLPGVEKKGEEGAVLDLASGRTFPAPESAVTVLTQLGIGDLCLYQGQLACFRGATAMRWQDDGFSPLEGLYPTGAMWWQDDGFSPMQEIDPPGAGGPVKDFVLYKLWEVPCRLLVTTTERRHFDVRVTQATPDDGINLEYREAEPALVPPEAGRKRARARRVKVMEVRPDWGPEQATGPPNTPGGEDASTAWAPETPDDQVEWLFLEYAQPVKAVKAVVHETFKPGAVFKVVALDPEGNEVAVWEGEDPTSSSAEKGVSEIPFEVDFEISSVRLYLASPKVKGFNEIDAVGLVDGESQTHWAASASASSTSADLVYIGHPTILRGRVNRRVIRDDEAVQLMPWTNRPGLPPKNSLRVGYVDNSAEDERLLAGAAHVVAFERPKDAGQLTAVSVFGRRYGASEPPEREFSVYVLDADQEVIRETSVKYEKVLRGQILWQTIPVPPTEVPERFYVALSFHSGLSDGVLLGVDENVSETHSYQGVPGNGLEAVPGQYDWMIRAYLERHPGPRESEVSQSAPAGRNGTPPALE